LANKFVRESIMGILRTSGVTQMVEHLPSTREALSSNSSARKKKSKMLSLEFGLIIPKFAF
jgi:hypothetical protein